MKQIIVVFAIAALAGCGAEPAATAVTGAVIKKHEIEEGKKTMERVQRDIDRAMAQARERTEKEGER